MFIYRCQVGLIRSTHVSSNLPLQQHLESGEVTRQASTITPMSSPSQILPLCLDRKKETQRGETLGLTGSKQQLGGSCRQGRTEIRSIFFECQLAFDCHLVNYENPRLTLNDYIVTI